MPGQVFWYWPSVWTKMAPRSDKPGTRGVVIRNGYARYSLYVPPYYTTLKEEAFSYGLITIRKWNAFLIKAMGYRQSQKIKNMKAKSRPTKIGYDIQNGDPMSLQHVLCIVLYCDTTNLQSHFSSTCRKKTAYESIEDLKRRHSKYHHFAKGLVEAIYAYGVNRAIDQVNGPFYCGLDRVLTVSEFSIYLRGPVSTSKDLSVAINFAARDGMILQLNNNKNASTFSSLQQMFDCSWISRYPEENERFFMGYSSAPNCMYPLRVESVRIIDTNRNYQSFFHAMQMLDYVVSDHSTYDTYKFRQDHSRDTYPDVHQINDPLQVQRGVMKFRRTISESDNVQSMLQSGAKFRKYPSFSYRNTDPSSLLTNMQSSNSNLLSDTARRRTLDSVRLLQSLFNSNSKCDQYILNCFMLYALNKRNLVLKLSNIYHLMCKCNIPNLSFLFDGLQPTKGRKFKWGNKPYSHRLISIGKYYEEHVDDKGSKLLNLLKPTILRLFQNVTHVKMVVSMFNFDLRSFLSVIQKGRRNIEYHIVSDRKCLTASLISMYQYHGWGIHYKKSINDSCKHHIRIGDLKLFTHFYMPMIDESKFGLGESPFDTEFFLRKYGQARMYLGLFGEKLMKEYLLRDRKNSSIALRNYSIKLHKLYKNIYQYIIYNVSAKVRTYDINFVDIFKEEILTLFTDTVSTKYKAGYDNLIMDIENGYEDKEFSLKSDLVIIYRLFSLIDTNEAKKLNDAWKRYNK